MNEKFEIEIHLLCEKVWKSFKAIKSHIEIKNVSPEESSVTLIVSLFNVACAYAYIRSIAEMFFFCLP